jgi:hypothetical protein
MPQTIPTPPPVVHLPQQTGELAMLKDQLTELARQLERSMKLRAQIAEKFAAVDGSTRTALEQQMVAAEVETGAIQAQVERVAAQIAEQEVARHTVVEVPPPFEPRGPFGISPDAITAVFVMFSIGIIVPLSIGLARRMWRRPQPVAPRETEVVSKTRLDRLEQAVDTIAIEIERISEGQRFVTRVLNERAAPRASAASEPGGASLNEGTPFLALGAGPVEAIPVVQRQVVKPSITPH